ncbi:MAG: hypothetical protein K0U68_02770 [Gammaproteobacteria bacterium]|nr:hypothetical protein [Gammaproteobacteria bacterium]
MSGQSQQSDTGFRPLNPSDQVLLAIDQEIRRDGNHGSHCGFALELHGELDITALQNSLSELQADFPALSSRLEQRGKTFGWKTIDDPIPFHHYPCPEHTGSIAEFQHNTMLSILNNGTTIDQSAPLQFHLIDGDSRRLLLLHWFHPLLDARGVKLILDYLVSGKRQRYTAKDFSLIDQRLKRWSLWETLKMAWNGKQYNDHIDRLNSDLPTPGSIGKQQLQCINQSFSTEQTVTIQQLAKQTVGMGYHSIYYIGCLMRALHRVGMAVKNDAICVPYAFNLRQPNAPVPVLGNHVSVLFSQAPHSVIENREQLFKHLSKQYAQTIRQGQDYSFIPWMWIGRWMSLEKYGKVLRQQRGGGERGSVWFSDIGELRFPSDTLFGATICGVRHLCILTSPPSFAVLFGQFQGRLNIAYNFLQPDIDSDWVHSVNRTLQQELLNDSNAL